MRFVEQISGVGMGYMILSLNYRNSILHLSHKVSLYVTLKGVYMLPFFILKSRVPKMITMMIKTVITPAIPPITANNPLEDVSWITENKQEI